MGPKEVLNDFVFFLPSGRLLELHCDPSRLDATSSGLSLSVLGGCRMGGGVPAKGTLTLKSERKGNSTLRGVQW